MSVTDRTSGTSGIVGGAAAGAAAYVLGYLFAYVTQGSAIEDQLAGFNVFADLFGGDPIPTWKAVGWVFYNGHFADTRVPSLVGGSQMTNIISQADGGSLTLLFVVPPVLLVVAGLVASRIAGATEPVDGAQAGASVLVGYLPLAVIGAFLFRHAVREATIAPDLLTAVLLAGAVYPAAFGAIGGAGATLLSD
ncbi:MULTISPECIES: transporter [unclassified Halorubrum]|uniref:transporter n=1 Tax=unclassified Halorubrum TaxID=2642239 RepID=UPI000B97D9CF|nr:MULTISPECIES: transporter [unclassified Halorubrum]OYR46456.1 transporter [Halorubrum sp. Hd13]OYR47906.1 transporter [Halorubrum sp. Ea8]